MSHGLIYHYFKTKDDVFTELFKNASVLKGISEYAAQSDDTPWEKIKNIVEIIMAMSLDGDGLYYWHIVNRAYTSEANPKEVRELILQRKTQISDVFVPIIIEGQKLGQIAQDDPLMLDTVQNIFDFKSY